MFFLTFRFVFDLDKGLQGATSQQVPKNSLMHGSFLSFWKEAIRIGSPDQVTKRPLLRGAMFFSDLKGVFARSRVGVTGSDDKRQPGQKKTLSRPVGGFLMGPVSAVTSSDDKRQPGQKKTLSGRGGDFFPTCRRFLLGPASAVAGSTQVKERPFRGGGV